METVNLWIRRMGRVVAVAALVIVAHGEPLLATQPNVVLIISDDQGYTDYGFMGHDTIKTPQIDKLASESLVFTRGYVTTALCCPSLATMLTGLYPHQHRITGNDPVNKSERPLWYKAFEKGPRLPAMLSKAGYECFQSGKFWLGHYSRAGFTDGMTVKGRHGEAGLAIGRKTMKPVFDFIDKSKAAQKPFFLWYAPFMPHTPHNPPERLLKKYKQAGRNAKYYAMCEWFDETCGQLLDHIEKQRLTDNTVIIYVCDNGWPGSAKGSPYEMGIRTPIMIKWPGRVNPRMDKEHLASNIDIVPSILAACGLKPSLVMPGIDLLDSAAVSKRRMIFGENFGHDMVNVDRPVDSLCSRTCIRDQWKLIVWQDPQPKVRPYGKREQTKGVALYNLRDDPSEKNNLAQKHPNKVAEMLTQLSEWWDPTTEHNKPDAGDGL